MDVRREILKKRTRDFALRIIHFSNAMPKSGAGRVIAEQVQRSGTSVGAQYAESCRAKSSRDFVNKIQSAMQELEETEYWLDLTVDSEAVKPARLKLLRTEIGELMSIFVTMVKNTKSRDE